MRGLGEIAWLLIMFLLAALITIVLFLSAVAPESRGVAFYVWMAVVCTGEFVFFAWSVNYSAVRRHGRGVSGATLHIVHAMIGIWFLIGILLAVVGGLLPGKGDQYHDVVAELFAVLTFVFLFAASSLYAKDLETQAEDRVTQPERVELQVWATAVDRARDELRRFGQEHADHTVAVDGLIKKLDAIHTSLQHAPPGKTGVQEEESGRSVSKFNTQIIALLEKLQTIVAGLSTARESSLARLKDLEHLAVQCESLLRQRQQFLLVGSAH